MSESTIIIILGPILFALVVVALKKGIVAKYKNGKTELSIKTGEKD